MTRKEYRAQMRRKHGPDWWKHERKPKKTPAVRDASGKIPTVSWRSTDWPARIKRSDGVVLKARKEGDTRWYDPEDGEAYGSYGDLSYEAKVGGHLVSIAVIDAYAGKYKAFVEEKDGSEGHWDSGPEPLYRGRLIKEIAKAPLRSR